MAERRLVRVFVWKAGSEPARDYVRQVLKIAVPEAVPKDDAAPLLVPVVERGVSEWPTDFWSYALPQMRQPIDWTDRSRYELSGWQGSDSRSNEKLFVVSIYARPQEQPTALTPAAPVYGQPQTPPANPPAYSPPNYNAPTFTPPAQTGYGQQPPPTGGINYGAPSGGFPVPGAPQQPQPPAYGPPTYQQPPYPQPNYPQPPAYNQPTYQQPNVNYGAAPANAYPGRTGVNPADLTGVTPGLYVGFGHRFVAALLDIVIVGLLEVLPFLALVLSGRNAADSQRGALNCLFLLFAVLIAGAYFIGFWGWRGQTPGMIVAGIKVVDKDGNKPAFGQVLLRFVGYLMSILTFGYGFLLIVSDDRKQGLHDRVASTFVVPTNPVAAPRPLAPASAYAPPAAPTYALPTPPAYTTPSAPTVAVPVVAPAPDGDALAPAEMIARSGVGERGERSLADMAAGEEQQAASAAATAGGDDAATLFRRGLSIMADGEREVPGGGAMGVEPEAANAALEAFRGAAAKNPGSAVYRYFSGVAQRHASGFEAARGDFAAALQADPGYWDARMQLYFGPSWHDAFAYSAWSPEERVLSRTLKNLLPQRPGARMTLLREGGGKTAAILLNTRRTSWKQLPTAAMPARIELVPAYSPFGLAIALYVALRDNPQDPYRAETFINPAEAPNSSSDATLLGQNLLLQLARQSHTYLIFADENGEVLLNRRLVFDPGTQYRLGQIAAAVQAAAAQATSTGQWLPVQQFQQAAQWHTERFPLNQIQV